MNGRPKTVCWILGTAYSGSSLLNLLLDGQPGVRGVGEAIRLLDGDARCWCTACRAPVAECPLRDRVNAAAFYRSIFRFYGDCTVLVDSSKWWKFCALDHPAERGLQYKALFLSKTPHAFVHSLRGHAPEIEVPEGFRRWWQAYPSVIRAAQRSPRLGPENIAFVGYRELVESTQEILHRLCRFLEVPFDAERCRRWWLSDSHLIGGNQAVFAQVADPAWFTGNEMYLDGKYARRRHTIFPDDRWRGDRQFLQACLNVYRHEAARLDPVLTALGYGPASAQRQDIQQALETLNREEGS